MPLTINVGLSRKSSENYQSKGTSINVTAELDQSLLAKPDQLQREIYSLYQQAHEALDHQSTPQRSTSTSPQRTNHSSNGSSDQPNGHVRAITASQKRALHAIADKQNIDLEQQVQSLYGCALSQLSIKEASTLIDRLKASNQSQPAATRRGTGR